MGKRYPSTNYFEPGAANTICDRTGFKRKTTEVMEEWTGSRVIPEAFNERHPQDFPYIAQPEDTHEDSSGPEADPADEAGAITII